MSITAFALQTNFNIKNAMANSTLPDLMRVRKETIRDCMSDFESEEHRLEDVFRINGVQYINDAKAVNVNATYYALDSLEGPIIWIAGGIDKGNDFENLLPLVNEKVKAIICLGINNERIIETFSSTVDFMIEVADMKEAVKIAYKLSDTDETVLLSPACASYDLFESFEEKGKQFKQAVREL